MSLKKKVFITIVSIIGFLAIALFATAYFLFLHHYKGTEIINEWNSSDQFDIESISTVSKKKDKDFVILNLADVQLCDLEDLFHMPTIHNEITYLVNETKPDLITLTGDQTWSNENLISLKSLIGWLDGYKIPYAPIFGNHDYGNTKNSSVAELNYCCDLYEKGKYSLFKRGPSNLGSLGNYVVNVVEDGKICKTLYFLDSGYEEKISDQQISWLEWNAEGIRSANKGNYSEGICFMHKPIPEYRTAYYQYAYGSDEVEAIGDVFVTYSLGGSKQNGFFEVAKQINVTDIVCGHQHGNCFTLKYQNIRLTFALKTGELGGFYSDDQIYLNGATAIKFDNGDTEIQNIFVDRDKYKI